MSSLLRGTRGHAHAACYEAFQFAAQNATECCTVLCSIAFCSGSVGCHIGHPPLLASSAHHCWISWKAQQAISIQPLSVCLACRTASQGFKLADTLQQGLKGWLLASPKFSLPEPRNLCWTLCMLGGGGGGKMK